MPAFRLILSPLSIGRRRLLCCLMAALTLPGCSKTKKAGPSVGEPPTIRIVQPETRTITRVVGQPSFVEAYERTSIYPKVTGFIQKWNVDIGDKVKKGDVLAIIYVPELREDYETKKATVKLDNERVTLAEKLVKVGEADVQAADARVLETKSILDQYQAQVTRWDTEVKRLTREVKSGVVDAQVLLESENQLKASLAKRNAAKAAVQGAGGAALEKSDARAGNGRRGSRQGARRGLGQRGQTSGGLGELSERDRAFRRRHRRAGAPTRATSARRSPAIRRPTPGHYTFPSGKAAPLYVVDRTDVVRIFVDVPEDDANFVHGESTTGKGDGNKAQVRIRGFRDVMIPATVTRTAWAST